MPITRAGLHEADVRRWTGAASFERGQRYARQGAIRRPRVQGRTLKADCIGSMPQPYRVEATLEKEGIREAACSCPVGAGGHCKHVAALLLTWIDDPEAFLEQEPLKDVLARRSIEDLIDLILKMVERHPELEDLVALPSPASTPGARALDPELIRRQVQNAFPARGYDDWHAAFGIALDLEQIVALGDQYLEQGRWQHAAVVYQTVAEEILEEYEALYDDEGEVALVVNDCAAKLGACLARAEEAEDRRQILRALFDIYDWDVQFGGIGIGDEVPGLILEYASPEERRTVAAWVRAVLPPPAEAQSSNWKREVYGSFLLGLEADALDDEAYLRICRETGRTYDLIERLLQLGRTDEAFEAVGKASDYELLGVADLFVAHGQRTRIRSTVQNRAGHSTDQRLVAWLRDDARAHNDPEAALRLSEQLFRQRPDLSEYKQVQEAARKLGRWDAVRAGLMARLYREERFHLLTEIHLADDEVGEALKTVRMQPSQRPGYFGGYGLESHLRIRVAEAAEADHPREAIEIYRQAAQQLVDARGRGNYAQAARYLARIRTIMHGQGEDDAWLRLIHEVRESHRNLPAFQDELNKAGLRTP